MGSGVKIRLLLGLMFVFVIAFLFAGLRWGDKNPNSGESVPVMVSESQSVLPEMPPEPDNSGEPAPPAQNVDSDSEIHEFESVEPVYPVVYYVVCTGDNLGDIAKKFYGPEEGNRTANVRRIFEANRKLLKSPDEIHVGQKLIIPPLKVTESESDMIEGVFPSSMFEQVESVGRRHIQVGGAAKGIRATGASIIDDG